MDVDRVVGHGQVAHTHPHPIVQARHQRADARKHPAVPTPDVLVQHGVHIGRFSPRCDVERTQQKGVVAVHLGNHRVLSLGVGDPQPHHAHGHLRHLVGVRVVHEGTWPACYKLIHKGLAHRDLFLVQATHAVHAIGQALAVPVDGGVLWQLVGHKDAHLVALDHLDGRTGALAVVAPHVDDKARCHLAHHWLSHQMELLDTVFHAKGHGPAIQRDHWFVGPASTGHAWGCPGRGCIGAGLDEGFGQACQRAAADGGGGKRCTCDGARSSHGFLEKISALHGQCPAGLVEGLAGPDASLATVG